MTPQLSLTSFTMTHTMSTLDRFELPDLLVALCEAGQTSLAMRIARTLLGTSSSPASVSSNAASSNAASSRARAARHARDLSERAAKDGGVARDESQSSRSIESLQDDLEATRHGR